MVNDRADNGFNVPQAAPLAVYANFFNVGHNAFEFLLDFGQFQPDSNSERMHSRMVTGPVHAKLLLRILGEAVTRFEREHGEIEDLGGPDIDSFLVPPDEFEARAARARTVSLPHHKLNKR
jgi:hypothetical protein